jgi:hypothetical protein
VAPVVAGVGGAGELLVGAGQQGDGGGQQGGLVVLDDEDVVGVGVGDDRLGGLALGVQGILLRPLRYADASG